MQKKLATIITFFFTLLLHNSRAQYYFYDNQYVDDEVVWEVGMGAGFANCLTDIGGKKGAGKKFIKDINWNQAKPAFSIFGSATWQSVIAVRAQIMFMSVSGNDAVLKNSTGIERGRYLRNLSFKTGITEFTLLTEFHPLFVNPHEKTPAISPYIAAGLGLFFYNPRAKFNNTWVDLRPLHTEGQGFKEYKDRSEYKSFAFCFPVGTGIKIDVGAFLQLRVELLYRITTTDYIDDVSTRYIDAALFNQYLNPSLAATATSLANKSNAAQNDQRGNPKDKDGYFSFGVKCSVVLGRNHR